MKVVIAILLTIIAGMALLVGATILLDSDDGDNGGNGGDVNISANGTNDSNGTDDAIPTDPVVSTASSFVGIAVSFTEDDYDARHLRSNEILDEAIISGVVSYAISFNGEDDNPFIYSNSIRNNTLTDDVYNVTTFIFSQNETSSTKPNISFVPGFLNDEQSENTHTFATYFVSINHARDSANPLLFTVPVPDESLEIDSFAVTFITTLDDSYFSANQLMNNSSTNDDTANTPRSTSTGGSISVEDAENILASLVSTWVYIAPDVHVEMTFMNDWRYYEIRYSPSGRPLSLESGVYSINCGRTITIQSGSIWGPTYIYNFSIDNTNNKLSLSYDNVNYLFTRQNRLPILSLENFPYTHTSGYIHTTNDVGLWWRPQQFQSGAQGQGDTQGQSETPGQGGEAQS